MSNNPVITRFIKNVAISLNEEFDKNFERKAFFDKAWKPSISNNRGSLMMRTGALRGSIGYRIQGNGSYRKITWYSSLPYASLHNEGGEITVTEKMKAFFWAMHLRASGAGKGNNSERAKRLNSEAALWKSLALKKVGSKIKVEKRQYIGEHPRVRTEIEWVWKNTAEKEMEQYINAIKRQT